MVNVGKYTIPMDPMGYSKAKISVANLVCFASFSGKFWMYPSPSHSQITLPNSNIQSSLKIGRAPKGHESSSNH